jgi:uncharacterized protein YxeA
MKNGKATIYVIIITIIIVIIGGGIYLWQTNKSGENSNQPSVINTEVEEEQEQGEEQEILSYEIVDSLMEVSKEEAPFDFTASQLQAAAQECGVNNNGLGYFNQLVSKFAGTSKIVYSFKYKGDSQDSGVFKVTIIPNKAGYTSIDQFKQDFDICSAGGEAYPKLVNKDWLLFVSSCGSGFDDGSGLIHGCDEVETIVEPSLKLL